MPVDTIPWAQIGGIGAAGVALVMCTLFLKHLSEMRKENGETIRQVSSDHKEAIEKVSGEFSSTVRDVTQKFSETAITLLRDKNAH